MADLQGQVGSSSIKVVILHHPDCRPTPECRAVYQGCGLAVLGSELHFAQIMQNYANYATYANYTNYGNYTNYANYANYTNYATYTNYANYTKAA